MSYRVRFTTHTGATGYWDGTFATRKGASMSALSRADVTGYTYSVEEVPDVSTAAVPDAPPSIRVMPRRVWEEQRIRALAQAIVRRMGYEEPKVATVFDFGHIHDWAAEIVELCQRNGGQQTAPNDAKEVPEAPEPGSTAAHHVEILRKRVEELEAELATVTASLTKAPSASEAPMEGGGDRRRLEVLERFLDGDTFRQAWKTTQGKIVAGTTIEGQEYAAPTLAALADKLAEMEGKR